MRNSYDHGKWNVICDRCGFKYKNTELKKEWTGLMVCCTCYETRHPQTLLKVPTDDPATPWSRPEPIDVFVGGDPILTESGDFIFTESLTILITES